MLPIRELKPYKNNPRNNDRAVGAVMKSIESFGFKVPIIIDKNNVIVAGHTRLEAAKRLEMDSVPCIVADDLTDEQIKAFRLADNKVSEFSEWDLSKLEEELRDISVDMSMFGFDSLEKELEELSFNEKLEETRPSLQEKYIVPPFSVLDTRQGYWQDRKNMWKQFIKSDEGRDTGLLGKGLTNLAKVQSGKEDNTLTGTSIFDPVLCEVLLTWFCPKNGKVIDPFAGGSVRGLVSTMLGNEYTGIDLSARQIEANLKNYEAIKDTKDFEGNKLNAPVWINEDSKNIDKLVTDSYDFLMTCPPYADLEVYSDDPRDISNMKYEDFREVYFEIIKKACDKLKDNAFAAITVGEVRYKYGEYYNFVSDTIEAFKRAGLKYYNECVLINQIGTGAMRADRQFLSSRKVVKTHQNVLVFLKGNEKEIIKTLKEYNYSNE